MRLKAELIDTARLSSALHAKRVRERLSIRDASKLSEVSAPTLSRLEAGQSQPDMETLAKIAQWLGVGLDTFLKQPNEEPKHLATPLPGIAVASAHFRADPHPDPDVMQALANVVRYVHDYYSNKK